MDYWNGIGTIDGKFPGASSNDVGLVPFVQRLTVLVVLVIRQHTSKDCVEFREARKKWTRKLLNINYFSGAYIRIHSLFAADERTPDEPRCSLLKSRSR